MKRFFFWGRSQGGQTPGDDDPQPTPGSDGLLTGNPKEDQASIQILLESIAEVTSGMELNDVLDRIARKSIQVTDAERALLMLGQDANALEIRIARDNRGRALGEDQQYSRTMVSRCLVEGQPVRSVVRSDQEALELGQSVFDLKLRAVMCAPLVAAGRTVGVIYVDSKAQRREFSGRDLALFGALSAQMAIAVENARLYRDSIEKVRLQKEIELARKIQGHLLTEIPRRVGKIEIALHFSACDQTSGDTYEVVQQPGGGVAIAIGDATGHGIGASLLTHAFQASLRIVWSSAPRTVTSCRCC
jgi:sigma-B regulation protein RsbU (phosphoserine phosphatase)